MKADIKPVSLMVYFDH